MLTSTYMMVGTCVEGAIVNQETMALRPLLMRSHLGPLVVVQKHINPGNYTIYYVLSIQRVFGFFWIFLFPHVSIFTQPPLVTILIPIRSDARICLYILCEFHWPIGHTTTTAGRGRKCLRNLYKEMNRTSMSDLVAPAVCVFICIPSQFNRSSEDIS